MFVFFLSGALAAPPELPTDQPALERDELVRSVLTQNPDLQAARAAWEAAGARPAQARAWSDPMVSYMAAPGSFTSRDVGVGHTLRVSQRFPFSGRLALAGDAAEAEAEAARGDWEAVRLRLAAEASQLYDAYALTARALSINDAHRALVKELRGASEAQYRAGRGSLQDPLQAEQELAHLERDRIGLEAEQARVKARLNGLLHRAPEAPLGQPPDTLAPVEVPDDGRTRPEAEAAAARILAAEATRGVAGRAWLPDVEVMGEYSSMWMEPAHQWMVGVGLEVPLQVGRRAAAIQEADATLRRARAQAEAVQDAVAVEVADARLAVAAARADVGVLQERLLPLARERLEAATSGLSTGRNAFIDVIDAARALRDADLSLAEARATLQQRAAELARASGLLPIGGTP